MYFYLIHDFNEEIYNPYGEDVSEVTIAHSEPFTEQAFKELVSDAPNDIKDNVFSLADWLVENEGFKRLEFKVSHSVCDN